MVRLTALPEIGKRTAETIIAELSGKVDEFVDGGAGYASISLAEHLRPIASDTMTMLTSLGESASEARRLVEHAASTNPDIETPEELLAAVYRLKETVA